MTEYKTNYELERIKKIEYLLLPECHQEYIIAQSRKDVETQAKCLNKIGELELELMERQLSYLRSARESARGVL